MENQSKKRNGTIEIMRFVFCMSVLLFHIGKYLFGEPSLKNGIHFALFPHGSIGVEFFFLVSGYLMAKSISKKAALNKKGDLGSNTISFMKNKYLSIFPYHVVALAFTFLVDCITRNWGISEIIRRFTEAVPNVFLIQMSGISFYNPNHITWYLSAMFIAMFVLYPLASKYYSECIKIIFPIGILLLTGWLVHDDNCLTGVMVWKGLLGYKGTIRAFIEIALGMIAFEISEYLRKVEINNRQKWMLRCIEMGCYVCAGVFIMMTFMKKYEVYVLFALFVAVTITFSGVTHIKALDNKVSYFLGKMSLPIYLCQVAAINIGVTYFGDMSYAEQIGLVVLLNFAFALVCQWVGELIKMNK